MKEIEKLERKKLYGLLLIPVALLMIYVSHHEPLGCTSKTVFQYREAVCEGEEGVRVFTYSGYLYDYKNMMMQSVNEKGNVVVSPRSTIVYAATHTPTPTQSWKGP